MKKQVWFDARDINPENNEMLSLIYYTDMNTLLVRAGQRRAYKAPHKISFVVEVESIDDLTDIPSGDIIISSEIELLAEAKKAGYKTCIFLKVDNKESLEMSWKIGMNYNYVIIDFESETNIPLELVIARLQTSDTVLLKKVTTQQEAETAFGVMEKGSDGVLIATTDIQEIQKMKKYMEKALLEKMTIVPGVVKDIQHIGMGHRGCIDTTSLLKPNEGMLIGSTSEGGILVSSETHYLPYMNLRPFRVNAGAIHSYVWYPENTTEYMTDIISGSKVLVVDHKGNAREVSVGRVKIEIRPLLKITVEVNGTEINTIVQDDWHIRILGINGEVYNATSLKKNDQIAAYVCKSGRHVGIKVEETIIEK